jgi:EmrB/QacA subfamily drug resistance transporter
MEPHTTAIGRGLSDRQRALAFAALLLGSLATMLNTSVVNVALPSIAADLRATGAQIDLIADGDSIALTALVLLFGAIGDTYGRKRMFVGGALLLAAFSLLCARAGSANGLLLGRLAVGASSAMLFPATLSMSTGLYPDEREKARAVAIWTGVAAVGAAVAPIAGGFLLEISHWGSIFLLSIPIALLAAGLAWRLLPEQRDEAPPPIDWVGGALAAVALSTLLFSIVLAPVAGITPETGTTIVVGAAALAGFVLWERRAAHPLLDLAAFRDRSFSGGSALILVLFLALAGVMFLSAQFTQNVLGYSPLQAGLAVLPLTLGVIAVTPFNPGLDLRFGGRRVGTVGFAVVALGLLSVRLWRTDAAYPLLATTFALLGVGLGLAMAPATSAILGSLPPEKAGVASAVNDLTRDYGGALGVAVMGALASLTYGTLLQQGYAALSPDKQAAIPDDVFRVIRGSLTGALAVAAAYPGPDADQLVAAARQAFLAGQERAAFVGAGLAIAGLVIAWTCLPDRREDGRR